MDFFSYIFLYLLRNRWHSDFCQNTNTKTYHNYTRKII